MCRLTKYYNGIAVINGTEFTEAAKKLAHYEDLEEQGRLIVQKQGQWIYEDVDWVCSECGEDAPTIPFKGKQYRANYCSNCGAKMELKELKGETDDNKHGTL